MLWRRGRNAPFCFLNFTNTKLHCSILINGEQMIHCFDLLKSVNLNGAVFWRRGSTHRMPVVGKLVSRGELRRSWSEIK